MTYQTALSIERTVPISEKKDRPQSSGEEIANSISHGIGLVAAIVAAPVLVVAAARRENVTGVVAVSVFAASMIALYLSSTLYHALPPGRAKRTVRHFDHAAIYLLIAGTYTPFTLSVLRGPWGWSLFGIVWGLAVFGVLLEGFDKKRARAVSVFLYLAMGWLAAIAARPIWLAMPRPGFFLLLLGGIAYTVGVPFYLARRMPYAHLVWHLCVLAGSACYFVAALWYAT